MHDGCARPVHNLKFPVLQSCIFTEKAISIEFPSSYHVFFNLGTITETARNFIFRWRTRCVRCRHCSLSEDALVSFDDVNGNETSQIKNLIVPIRRNKRAARAARAARTLEQTRVVLCKTTAWNYSICYFDYNLRMQH